MNLPPSNINEFPIEVRKWIEWSYLVDQLQQDVTNARKNQSVLYTYLKQQSPTFVNKEHPTRFFIPNTNEEKTYGPPCAIKFIQYTRKKRKYDLSADQINQCTQLFKQFATEEKVVENASPEGAQGRTVETLAEQFKLYLHKENQEIIGENTEEFIKIIR